MKTQKITLTLDQIESLLNQQKRKTIEKLLSHTYLYNTESSGDTYKSLTIDKDKFTDQGMESSFPDDIEVLKKYLID
jgi:hypothetical protein